MYPQRASERASDRARLGVNAWGEPRRMAVLQKQKKDSQRARLQVGGIDLFGGVQRLVSQGRQSIENFVMFIDCLPKPIHLDVKSFPSRQTLT